MNLQDRMQEYLRYMGINAKTFELNTGLSNGACAKLNETIRKSTCDRISKAYPNLNIDWLLTGEGEMLKVGAVQRAGGNSTQVAGNSNNVNNGATLDKALDEIAEQRKLVASSQAQIDRLLAIIENMTARN